jgi:hypothetical protein
MQDLTLFYVLSKIRKRLHQNRELFLVDLGKDTLHVIRKSIYFSMSLGNNRSKEEIEQTFGRK